MAQEQETINEATALTDIHNIANNTLITNDYLIKINTDLDNISDHISSLDDYLVIQKIEKEKKENEQNTKKTDKEDSEKITKQAETEETEEVVTLNDVYSEIQKTNELLTTQNTIQITYLFSTGILCGVILMALFWNRLFK